MGYYLQTTPGILVILVRHGATALNNPANPKLRGWEDVPLASEGRTAIQMLASQLSTYKPQYIFSSDLMRDSETANILGDRLGITGREVDFNARTWDVGSYSGKTEADANPAIEQLYRRPWEAPAGSQESFNGFAERWLGYLDQKMQFAMIEGMRPSIIVSHGRNLALADSHFNQKNAWDGLMPLAGGYTTLSVATDRSVQCEVHGESELVVQDV